MGMLLTLKNSFPPMTRPPSDSNYQLHNHKSDSNKFSCKRIAIMCSKSLAHKMIRFELSIEQNSEVENKEKFTLPSLVSFRKGHMKG